MESFKRNWTYYLAALLFALGLFLWSKGHAYQNTHSIAEIQRFYCRMKITDNRNVDNREEYLVKLRFHQENAKRCFDEAKDGCWWLPNVELRKQAHYCITNAGILALPTDPRSKIITAVISALVQYGIECCEEWEHINTKLHWAQYHYEMAEFYENMLTNI